MSTTTDERRAHRATALVDAGLSPDAAAFLAGIIPDTTWSQMENLPSLVRAADDAAVAAVVNPEQTVAADFAPGDMTRYRVALVPHTPGAWWHPDEWLVVLAGPEQGVYPWRPHVGTDHEYVLEHWTRDRLGSGHTSRVLAAFLAAWADRLAVYQAGGCVFCDALDDAVCGEDHA